MPSPSATKFQIRDEAMMNMPLGTIPGSGGLIWHNLYDPFDLLPPVGATAAQKDLHFSITGTGTVPTPVLLARGGVTIATRTTSTADNDEARLFPFTASNWGIAVPPTANKWQMIETIFIPTQITECQFYFGWKLTDSGVVATDADQALFLFDTDNTTSFGPAGSGTLTANANWNCVVSVAGSDVNINSNLAVVAATAYRLAILIGSDRRPRFYINNNIVATGAAMTATAALFPTMGVATRVDAGGAKSFAARYIRRAVSIP